MQDICIHGSFKYPNGDYYEGQYKNGVINGLGTYYFVNGDKFTGEFIDSKKEGNGEFHYASGDIFKALWKSDEPIFGTFFFNNHVEYFTKDGYTFNVEAGDTLRGEWKGNKKQGIHILTDCYGSQYKLLFSDDNLLCELVDTNPTFAPPPVPYHLMVPPEPVHHPPVIDSPNIMALFYKAGFFAS